MKTKAAILHEYQKPHRLEEINQGFKDLEAGKNARGVIVF